MNRSEARIAIYIGIASLWLWHSCLKRMWQLLCVEIRSTDEIVPPVLPTFSLHLPIFMPEFKLFPSILTNTLTKYYQIAECSKRLFFELLNARFIAWFRILHQVHQNLQQFHKKVSFLIQIPCISYMFFMFLNAKHIMHIEAIPQGIAQQFLCKYRTQTHVRY